MQKQISPGHDYRKFLRQPHQLDVFCHLQASARFQRTSQTQRLLLFRES